MRLFSILSLCMLAPFVMGQAQPPKPADVATQTQDIQAQTVQGGDIQVQFLPAALLIPLLSTAAKTVVTTILGNYAQAMWEDWTGRPNMKTLRDMILKLGIRLDELTSQATSISNALTQLNMNTLLVPINKHVNVIETRYKVYVAAIEAGKDAAVNDGLSASVVQDVYTAALGLQTELTRANTDQNVMYAVFKALATKNMDIVTLFANMRVFGAANVATIGKAVHMMKVYAVKNNDASFETLANQILRRISNIDSLLQFGANPAIPKALSSLVIALSQNLNTTKKLSAEVSWHADDERVRTTLMNGFTTADSWLPTFAKMPIDSQITFGLFASFMGASSTMFPQGPTTDRFLLEGDVATGKFVMKAVFVQPAIRGNYLMYGKAMSDPRGHSGQDFTAFHCHSAPSFQAFKANRSTEGNWFKLNKANYEFELIWDSTVGNIDKVYLQGNGWAMMTGNQYRLIKTKFIRPDRLIDSMRFPAGYKPTAKNALCAGVVQPDAWSGLNPGLKGLAGPVKGEADFDYRFAIKPYAPRTEITLGQSLWWSEVLETATHRFGFDLPRSTLYLMDRKTGKNIWTQPLPAKELSSGNPLLTLSKTDLVVCPFNTKGCTPMFTSVFGGLGENAKLVLLNGVVKVVDDGKTIVSYPNEKNVELLSDPGVETDDFAAGKTNWHSRFTGFCKVAQLGSQDGEGAPQEGQLFAKVVKDHRDCLSVFSDTTSRLMTLGDKYRWSVFTRLPPGGRPVKIRLAIWTCGGDNTITSLEITKESWTSMAIEYTVTSKAAGRYCSVRAEIYLDSPVGSVYHFDSGSLKQI